MGCLCIYSVSKSSICPREKHSPPTSCARTTNTYYVAPIRPRCPSVPPLRSPRTEWSPSAMRLASPPVFVLRSLEFKRRRYNELWDGRYFLVLLIQSCISDLVLVLLQLLIRTADAETALVLKLVPLAPYLPVPLARLVGLRAAPLLMVCALATFIAVVP